MELIDANGKSKKSNVNSNGNHPNPLIANHDLVILAANPLGPCVASCKRHSGQSGDQIKRQPNGSVVDAPTGGGRNKLNAKNASDSASVALMDNSQLVTRNSSGSLGATSVNCVGQSTERDVEIAVPRVQILRRYCFHENVRKVACGLLLTAGIGSSWVGATHFVKRAYLYREGSSLSNGNFSYQMSKTNFKDPVYYAPFFTTWLFTICTGLFFPLYVLGSCCCCCRSDESGSFISMCTKSVRTLQEKGFTVSKFFSRSGLFCALWFAANYMFIHAVRILDTTDVLALYSTNVSFIYLLSWVILHEQFVGVRIVAVIMCNTGIALLAYMDGLTKTPTLGGVILGAASSAGSAVFKVLFKKMFGEASFNQVALFFTVISLFNTFLLWPIAVALYFTEMEIFHWERMPWTDLTGAAALSLVTNLLGTFGIAVTYEIFITLGLVIAIPMSAAMDIYLYDVRFAGMKLSGIILIIIGFMLVLFPDNWPDFVTKLIHLKRRAPPEQASIQDSSCNRSRLRSPSGLVR
ncbi:hypothetical protein CHUAL_008602 [Chamberlinius hualienensis]